MDRSDRSRVQKRSSRRRGISSEQGCGGHPARGRFEPVPTSLGASDMDVKDPALATSAARLGPADRLLLAPHSGKSCPLSASHPLTPVTDRQVNPTTPLDIDQ